MSNYWARWSLVWRTAESILITPRIGGVWLCDSTSYTAYDSTLSLLENILPYEDRESDDLPSEVTASVSCRRIDVGCRRREERKDCKVMALLILEMMWLGENWGEFLYDHKEGRLTASKHMDASRLDQKTMSVTWTAFGYQRLCDYPDTWLHDLRR